MLKIVNFNERTSEDGNSFFTLTIQGGIELVQSKQTGNFYATAKKTSITSTFDEDTCKALIGTDIAGTIQKVTCEPYMVTLKETGEKIQLSHRYEYIPEVPSEQKEIEDKNLAPQESEVFKPDLNRAEPLIQRFPEPAMA